MSSIDFAPFTPNAVRIKPCIKPYRAASDLRNVANREMFDLGAAQKAALVENGFVVVPRFHKQLFSIYVENKDREYPSFITADLLLHTFHVMYNDTLKKLEERVFLENLQTLTWAMLQASLEQHRAATSSEVKSATEMNVCFFAVAQGILNPKELSLPQPLAQKVRAELRLIQAHNAVMPSPTFGYDEDYTHYIPRGHYDESTELKRYFQCLMWYSRMMFRVAPEEREKGRQETLSALLITLALKNTKAGDSDAITLWDELYSPTSFFVGVSDDLNVYDYLRIAEEVFGTFPSIEDLSDAAKIDRFLSLAQEMPGPSISSAALPSPQEMPRWATITKGFRFMGSRFIPDSYIFMELVLPKVVKRPFPTGLDVMAVLSSERAKEILNDVYQEFNYEGYAAQMERLIEEFSAYPLTTWTQNLYWSWLYCLRALLGEAGEGYPPFMQNKAWQDKELNTALGSWAELKHDVLLYAKQPEVLAETEEMMEEPKLDLGYVEPVPEFYARLAALIHMTWEGLEKRGIFQKLEPVSEPERRGDRDEDWDAYMDELEKWERELRFARKSDYQGLESILLKLKEISEKELQNIQLSEEEYEFIKDIGYRLAWLNFYTHDPLFHAEDMSIVADVYTESFAFQECLEVAVGRAMELYAVVNIKDKLRIARGSVFSYYEFLRPMAERMTDAQWRELQEKGPLPPHPVWTRSFIKGGRDID